MILAIAIWLGLWAANIYLARNHGSTAVARGLAPILFGLAILVLWQSAVSAFEISPVILPAPTVIFSTFLTETQTLWIDFRQTVLRGALSGFLIGTTAAFVTALIIDRSPFLTRGLLPIGNFVAALPIVGIAPILVSWFGFGWQSKAAVVVALVFFPMLVNTVQGLAESTSMQRDLMRTFAANHWQTLLKLRLPAALPFIFNGLKISTTLALIGAIVAEFFGSPTFGMGFRISTSVGQLALDMVWAEIVVAAIAGSVFYGLTALIESRVTFWHPSQRA